MLYSILNFIWNLSGFCMVCAIIYIVYYAIYITYENINLCIRKIINYLWSKKVNNLELKENVILIEKEIILLKNSIDLINKNFDKFEKKITNNIVTSIQDFKCINDLELKDINNRIFKLKCIIES